MTLVKHTHDPKNKVEELYINPGRFYFIEAMIINYFKHEYHNESIYIHPELTSIDKNIYDTMIDSLNIDRIIDKYIKINNYDAETYSDRWMHSPLGEIYSIELFVERIKKDEYYEMVGVSVEYSMPELMKAKHILRLLKDSEYTCSRIIIALFPDWRWLDKEKLPFSAEKFEMLKARLLNLKSEELEMIFNVMNDLMNFHNYMYIHINDLIEKCLDMLDDGIIKNYLIHRSLSISEHRNIERNLKLFEIKILSLQELSKYSINPKIQLDYAEGWKWEDLDYMFDDEK